jgi:glycosyltransferase involved in cell wall biosynthesis|tara:strand:- start:478 stop:1857 length:1380 start_codon:yes stop_codon:yes gene_type:complete
MVVLYFCISENAKAISVFAEGNLEHLHMKKILVITYYWPPASGPGVQRFLKFVKYFSSFGIHPTILTVKNGSYSSVDPSLMGDVPMEVSIYKTKAIEPFALYNLLRGKKGKSIEVGMGNIKNTTSLFGKLSRYIRSNFFIPDARVGWNSYATKEAIKICKRDGIDTIITTGPPHSTHLIGMYLKKNVDGIKWIADLRDPWTSIYYEKYLNRSKKSTQRNQELENEVLTTADQIVVVSHGMKQEFQDRTKSISVIANGFDGADINIGSMGVSKKFVFAYTGNFKANQNISPVWQALNELCKEDKNFNEHFVLRLTGFVNVEIRDAIDKNDLGRHVEYEDFVTHDVAVSKMVSSNLLYLPIPQAENNQLILTGKIFEYMASHTPILSVGPIDGNAATILTDCDRGEMFDYDNKEGIKSRIKTEYAHWKDHGGMGRKEESEEYRKYERKTLTKVYADLISKL